MKNKSLKSACAYIADSTFTCPHDQFDWEHPDTCELNCKKMHGKTKGLIEKVMAECWYAYFNGRME